MSAILYARVSTNEQADKELSIPTQIRVLKRICTERGWPVKDIFTDVGSGTSLKQRPGLVAAVNKACKNEDVEYLFVHRLDRFARSMIIYLTLKEKLQREGVRLVSAVENCEDTPVGQFIEHIMAAQAEFYSASLSERVKDGLKERLRSGHWAGVPPLGYLSSNGSVIVDPARGRFIVKAFQLWSTGAYTSKVLAEELYQSGFVSKHGKRVAYSKLCRILHNPFYMGKMRVSGEIYDGIHPPLISEELFERCEEVFRTKFPNRGKQRKHCFLPSRKLICRDASATWLASNTKRASSVSSNFTK